jgi:MFS family permease
MNNSVSGIKSLLHPLVIVAALGYMVDIYDMILFNIVKKESLLALGLGGDQYASNEILLFNWQLAGMLIGGFLWGVLGDKRGRLSVMFGSIILYSVANIANAFVTTLPAYAVVRFIAGIGLAGELGAGVTVVVEAMSKEYRGYGTMLIVTMGALGGVLASLMGSEGQLVADSVNGTFGLQLAGWQMAYLIGGVLGLFLLFLRLGLHESGMFARLKQSTVERGNFLMLFAKPILFRRYIYCFFIGLPTWYIVGIVLSLGLNLVEEQGVKNLVMSTVILYFYLGFTAGDLVNGALGQLLKSRKKVIIGSLMFSVLVLVAYFFSSSSSPEFYYWLYFLIGFFAGYWALFITVSSEQFGTNIRATVTTTIPNFVRGAAIIMTLGYKSLSEQFQELTPYPKNTAALVVGVICFSLAAYGIYKIRDTYNKELDYVETV